MALLDDADRLLVEQNVEFARGCAKMWMRRLGKVIEPDELFSIAYEGLCDAAARFSPDRGTFRSYAFTRIRGAIVDEARVRLGREGTVRPHRIPAHAISSLEELDSSGFQARADDDSIDSIESRDFIDCMLAQLPEREKLCMTLLLLEGLHQYEIAEVLGVTPARVSQLVASAGRRILKADRSGLIANAA